MSMKLWEPTPQAIESSNVSQFIKQVSLKEGVSFGDFHQLREWSVKEPEKFWSYVWEFCGVIASVPYSKVIFDKSRMPGARWFIDARLNFAKNLLRFNDEQEAIIFWNEDGPKRKISYAELNFEVRQYADALASLGLSPGDRVAAIMPNIPEAIILMLACVSQGLVWSSCSPEFSAQGVLDRFSQIEPKVLFAVNSYLYKSKSIALDEKINVIQQGLPTLKLTVTVPYLDYVKGQYSSEKLSEFKKRGNGLSADFKELPSDHPLYILFSSGTTGRPKCIVHGASGILIEHLKEHILEVDLKRTDRIFYATSCGWMMWNWLASALASGATLLLYDGFPLAREGKVLFDLAEKERMTVFGTSAGFIQKVEEIGLRPRMTHNLERLRLVLSTGSRLKPGSFDYIYQALGNVQLSPIWGGTDLCGCLGISSPLLPVYRDQIQTRGLGLAVDIVDSELQSVKGVPGEVVVRAPFPSMPLGFLNDDGSKYRAAYFEELPGVWRHGDLAILHDSGGITVLGRSDDTLNPAGVRIGAAEVTSAAERVPQVLEALAVGQEWQNDERIVLFVVLAPGSTLSEEIKQHILNEMPSPRHRPKVIISVSAFPVTLSGKVSARAVRDLINGRNISNLAALSNPEALEQFKNIGELKIRRDPSSKPRE